jgi:hypothetical protein
MSEHIKVLLFQTGDYVPEQILILPHTATQGNVVASCFPRI